MVDIDWSHEESIGSSSHKWLNIIGIYLRVLRSIINEFVFSTKTVIHVEIITQNVNLTSNRWIPSNENAWRTWQFIYFGNILWRLRIIWHSKDEFNVFIEALSNLILSSELDSIDLSSFNVLRSISCVEFEGKIRSCIRCHLCKWRVEVISFIDE